MKKKISALFAGLALLLAFQAGVVMASSEMQESIDKVIGTKYKYGGNTTSGFDCSGFIIYIFNQASVDLPRRSADQATVGTKVAKADLKPGDLVFFDTSGKNNGNVSHAGIYVGDGSFAHASSSRGVVIDKLDSSYYKTRYVTARRVLDEESYQAFAVEAVEEKEVQVAAAKK
ncbi:C40 family peptidase [Paenibacillus chungangensis]|uniref:C40 family peptidase n=1 Tax=Paenibacillus chungangensis TaxID=696535 RepID=A0ABW3HJY9_9BACL